MTGAAMVPGAPLVPASGFARAACIGEGVAEAGTDAAACTGDVLGQTKRCLEITLAAAATRPQKAPRSQIRLIAPETRADATRAHGEVFAYIRQACTFGDVSRFIDPDWLVETELDAVVKDPAS